MSRLKIPLTQLGHLCRINGYSNPVDFAKYLSNATLTEVEVVHSTDKPPILYRNGEKMERPLAVTKVPSRITVKAILTALNNPHIDLRRDDLWYFTYDEGNVHLHHKLQVRQLCHFTFSHWVQEGLKFLSLIELGKSVAENTPVL